MRRGTQRTRKGKGNHRPAQSDKAVPQRQSRNNVDPEIVRRRMTTVNHLRVDGYDLREISDALLTAHLKDGSPLFTFLSADRQPLPEGALSYDEMRERAFETVKKDVQRHREQAGVEQPNATRLADDRYLLAERLRTSLKRLIVRMEGDSTKRLPAESDNSKYNQMLRTAIDIVSRIARLQGIETEKPMELRLPERYRAWIDEDGIVHKEKLSADVTSDTPPEKPN